MAHLDIWCKHQDCGPGNMSRDKQLTGDLWVQSLPSLPTQPDFNYRPELPGKHLRHCSLIYMSVNPRFCKDCCTVRYHIAVRENKMKCNIIVLLREDTGPKTISSSPEEFWLLLIKQRIEMKKTMTDRGSQPGIQHNEELTAQYFMDSILQ